MKGIKQFLGYVMPGLALLLQIIFILFLKRDFDIIKDYSETGPAIIAFFMSGIIGYIFSNMYYWIFWRFYFTESSKLNFKRIIRDNIDLFKDSFSKIDFNDINQREAWAMINVYWKMECDEDGEKVLHNKHEGLDKQSASLNYLLHSLGTTLTIMIIGYILGMFILGLNSCNSCCNLMWYSLGNLPILIFLYLNYQIIAETLQSMLKRSHEKLRFDIKKESGTS